MKIGEYGVRVSVAIGVGRMGDLSGRQAGGIMAGNFRLLPIHLSKGRVRVPRQGCCKVA